MTKSSFKIYKSNFNQDPFEDSTVTENDFKKMEMFYSMVEPLNVDENQVINSKFVGINSEYFLFDAGLKDLIRVENRPIEAKYLINTNIGDTIDVLVTKIENRKFLIKGSISEIYETMAHNTLLSLDEGVSVSATVKSMTSAGYILDIQYEGVTLTGFMPNTLAGVNKLYSPESILNQTMQVMIESFSKDEGTYIVSRRRYLKTLIGEETKKLKTGIVYTGNVTGTAPFGVFVEFNECLTGMIHKTNLNPAWQDKINEISPGFEIDFYVKEILKDKIILTQILKKSLWDKIELEQTFEAKVKEIKQYGVLVYLDNETIGLVNNPSRNLNPNDTINVKVTYIDKSSRKIHLAQI